MTYDLVLDGAGKTPKYTHGLNLAYCGVEALEGLISLIKTLADEMGGHAAKDDKQIDVVDIFVTTTRSFAGDALNPTPLGGYDAWIRWQYKEDDIKDSVDAVKTMVHDDLMYGTPICLVDKESGKIARIAPREFPEHGEGILKSLNQTDPGD